MLYVLHVLNESVRWWELRCHRRKNIRVPSNILWRVEVWRTYSSRDSKSFVDSSGIRDSRRGRLEDMTCGLAVGLHHVTTVYIGRRGVEVRRTRVIGGRWWQ